MGLKYTAHNIILPDGTQTKPDVTPLKDTGIFQAACRTIDLVYPGSENGVPTVADLGCLEGGYAAEFAKRGYLVTGVEAHYDNIACCEEVEAALGLPRKNLQFIQADVRDIHQWVSPSIRHYDVVFCCGLLYHLDEPAKFLRQLANITDVLILQTHFSSNPVTTNEGYRGHWFGEQLGGRWSSYRNHRSFWLAKEELFRAMHEAGFKLVYEQHDYKPDASKPYLDMFGQPELDRGMFVGIK